MREPLDNLYFEWLYKQVRSTRLKHPSKTYWCLFRQLYTKEFIWIVPNDDNRIEDGRGLRYDFFRNLDYEVDEDWMHLGCSFLEMLIALSQRLSFEGEGEARDWFWEMLDNIKVGGFNDEVYTQGAYSERVVNDILDSVIWRTYRRNGRGGLFPLQHAREDQRDVEIWYQMNAYLLELE